MNTKIAHVVNLNATVNRVLFMCLAIVVGILLSYSSAEAGIKVEKNPFTKSIQKKKNHTYSCEVLMKKYRNSTNMGVKSNSRKPKWR